MASSLSATVTLMNGMSFNATATSGHGTVMDASEHAGGLDRGFRPMEMLLMGLGGCTGMDVISILRKKRQEVVEYQISVLGDRTSEHPMVYTRIAVEHVVTGKGVSAEAVRRAIELSVTRYCPSVAMLSRVTPMVHRYRVIDLDTGAEESGEL